MNLKYTLFGVYHNVILSDYKTAIHHKHFSCIPTSLQHGELSWPPANRFYKNAATKVEVSKYHLGNQVHNCMWGESGIRSQTPPWENASQGKSQWGKSSQISKGPKVKHHGDPTAPHNTIHFPSLNFQIHDRVTFKLDKQGFKLLLERTSYQFSVTKERTLRSIINK